MFWNDSILKMRNKFYKNIGIDPKVFIKFRKIIISNTKVLTLFVGYAKLILASNSFLEERIALTT